MNWIRYYLSNWYNSQNSLGLILLIKELRAGQTANTLSYAAVKLLTSSWMSKLASSCQPALTLRYRLTFSFFFFCSLYCILFNSITFAYNVFLLKLYCCHTLQWKVLAVCVMWYISAMRSALSVFVRLCACLQNHQTADVVIPASR